MRDSSLVTVVALGLLGVGANFTAPSFAAEPAPLRPPAVPLVVHDPYFSVWSFNDHLYDDWPRHWTGATNGMFGQVRIDGKTLRFLGGGPKDQVLPQTGLAVTPTHTRYTFADGAVELEVVFLSPLLPQDLDLCARPLTYVTFSAKALDGKPHDVQVYLDASAEWSVDQPVQPVVWSRVTVPGLNVGRIGTKEQPILKKSGDNRRIDFGYFHLASPADAKMAVGTDKACRTQFAEAGTLPATDDTNQPRPANENWPVIATAFALKEGAPKTVLVAYDDIDSIEFMGKPLKGWWKRDGMTIEKMLSGAAADHEAVEKKCAEFDAEFTDDLLSAGGPKYAAITALAFRQATSAQKIVAGPDGAPWMFEKECFSNGCIATVDVIYPAAPLYLLMSPALARGHLTPIMEYAASDKWPYPYAPHDLGTYPKANGQVYGMKSADDGARMPVEESGNMLLLLGAVARLEGNSSYSHRYWPQLEKWADYLLKKGFDPENQLCTDDFAGHLAHNANLSIKAILAIAAYSQLCALEGKTDDAARYLQAAKDMVPQWLKAAGDGDHFRLAFDRPGSWSQKYNLVWDRLLGLNLFPTDIAKKEMAFYLAHQQQYGLPLDSRKTYTKLDWTIWTATLTGSHADLDALAVPLHAMLNASPSRVPMTDWFETTTAKMSGFQHRSVVGGLFIPLLYDAAIVKKWTGRATPKVK